MRINEFEKGIEIHPKLNPKLWAGQHLHADVRARLQEIAEVFYEYLEVDVAVVDIIVTGSQASRTYTGHSDLDLHLIVPYKDIQCDQAVSELLDTKRKLWKTTHDITIYGVPVECYAEDEDSPVNGPAYSIVNEQWIRTAPEPGELPEDVDRVTLAWIRVITAAVKSQDQGNITDVKNLLSQYRRQGLKSQGELGRANIVYKTLRNNGVISLLMQALVKTQDLQLGLD